jgi:hypothetical protein
MILARLWLIFNGKQECQVASIKNFLDTQSAVLQFRFMTGLHARTLAHADKIIRWSRNNDEDVAAIAQCGTYFELEKPALKPENKLPSTWIVVLTFAALVLLSMTTLGSAMAIFFDRAVLTMKDTGTVFTMDSVTAKPVTFHKSPSISLKDCPALINTSHQDFTSSDIKHVCEWAQDPATNAEIAHAIKEQRWVLIYFISLLLYVSVPIYLTLTSMVSAKGMNERLKKRRKNGRQSHSAMSTNNSGRRARRRISVK